MFRGQVVICGGAWHDEVHGGAYKVASEFARYLAASGRQVSYVAWSPRPVAENPTRTEGVALWRYQRPDYPSPSPLNAAAHVVRTRSLVHRIARTGPIQHVNGHDFLQFIGATGRPTRGAFMTLSVHSPLVEEQRAHWTGGAASSYGPRALARRVVQGAFATVEGSAYRRAQVIQTDSDFTRSLIRASYPADVGSRAVTCPPWVDTERFTPAPDREAVRRTLGGAWAAGKGPLFLSVRRLVPRMGLDVLVDAVGLLRDQKRDCRLVIGGTGPEAPALQARTASLGLADRVSLVGRISDEDLPRCYQAADCFVLPTRALECFGLIILEAFASGTPVIATPVGAIPEVMAGIPPGWIAEEASAAALASRMLAYLDGNRLPVDLLRGHACGYSTERRARALADLLVPAQVA